MTSPWAPPDLRPAAGGTDFGSPVGRGTGPGTPGRAPVGPPWWQDLWAGLLTVAVTVLVGAPVGLLWAAVAPRVVVVIRGDEVDVLDVGDSFIAVDGYFLAAVLVAGAVGGSLAWWLGSPHGPAVVLGLTVGGLAAAWVAMTVGGLVDHRPVRELLAAGVQGRRELAVQLRATTALLGWPTASLLTFLALALWRGRDGSAT